MTIESLFTGSALVIVGFVVVMFSRTLSDMLATPDFVVRFFGPGREDSFYKLMGVLVIIIGFSTMVGLHRYIIDLLLSPFTTLL